LTPTGPAVPVDEQRVGRRPKTVERADRERESLETCFGAALAEEIEPDVPHLEPPADVGNRLVDLARELHPSGRYARREAMARARGDVLRTPCRPFRAS
jgi:hypothetical protein